MGNMMWGDSGAGAVCPAEPWRWAERPEGNEDKAAGGKREGGGYVTVIGTRNS